MQSVEERLNSILQKYNIPLNQYNNLDVIKKIRKEKSGFFNKINVSLVIAIVSVLLYQNFPAIGLSDDCLIEMPSDASKVFREPENCDICESVMNVPKITNISSTDFYLNYAKKSKPVVVADGAISWPALREFNYDFFKKLYSTIDINYSKKRNCQFFPYKTEFKSLKDVFEMPEERAKLAPGEKPWYIGWSNCNDEVGQILQKYYEKPYFLANQSENIALSWIFMGGPGHGAHMHVDNVHYPSWQAQLSGRKLWKLAPPPECLYKCNEMEITVEPGEIIALDTNRWYHQTFVLPGEISITIGSEFD